MINFDKNDTSSYISAEWMMPLVETLHNNVCPSKGVIDLKKLTNYVMQDKINGKINALHTAIVKYDEKLLNEILKINPNIDGILKENKNLIIYNLININQLKFLTDALYKNNLTFSEVTQYDKEGFNLLGKMDLQYDFDNLEKLAFLVEQNHPQPHKKIPLLHFIATKPFADDAVSLLLEKGFIDIKDMAASDCFGFTPVDLGIHHFRHKVLTKCLEIDTTLPYFQKFGTAILTIHGNWSQSRGIINEDTPGFWKMFLTKNSSPTIEKELNMILDYPTYKFLLGHDENFKKINEMLETMNRTISQETVKFLGSILEQRSIEKDLLKTQKLLKTHTL